MGRIDKSLSLTNRERMIRTCLNQDIDRQPFWFMFGPWGETIDRWKTEGLQGNWREGMGLDGGFRTVDVNLGYSPEFKWTVLADEELTQVVIDSQGVTKRISKDGNSIPQYLDCPVKNRQDWERIKAERLQADDPARFPQDWEMLVESYKNDGHAIQIGRYPYGLFGTVREMMGVEELLVAFYDEPELISDIMDYLTDFWIAIYRKVLKHVQIDHIHIWEDMSGKHGSLISPDMFREFMMPNYKKIVAFAKENGIAVVSVDTDGNMDQLMPLLREAGINLVLPFEVQAGCDVSQIKKDYPDICLHGGIDKRALTFGFAEIDAELDRIGGLYNQSGYIPALDHLVHPEVSLENFRYFMKRLKEKIYNAL